MAELQQLGVVSGDRVMVLAENGTSLVVLFLAISELQATTAVINPRLSGSEILLIRNDCQPRLELYCAAESTNAADHAKNRDCTKIGICGHEVLAFVHGESQPFEVDDDPVAAMIYTTGTTGSPKGVMLTHRNLAFIADVSGKLRGINAGDKVYCVLPMSHVFGLSAVCCSVLFAAGTVRLVPRFDAAKVVADLQAEPVVGFLGVPTMYAMMLESLGTDEFRASDLRFMYAGGSPLDPGLKSRVEEKFGLPLHNGYGLTESGPTICQTRLYAPLANCSVGFALPGVDIRIQRENGDLVTKGEVGELWARGPNIMKGYFGKPEMTAQVLVDGWFNTGDLVFEDNEGCINIAGRSKELIIRSGFNVYPPEIEAVITSYPGIALAAVLGRQAGGDEEIVAFVQAEAGKDIQPEALKAYLREHLTGYKIPAEIRMVSELPAAVSGKILKHQLKEWL